MTMHLSVILAEAGMIKNKTMLTVTNEQIYDRWEHVPESLKEAFFSPENGDIIWKACEETGLSDEVAEQVLIVAGNIMLGFTQFNDLASELRSIPGMDPQAIDRVIFQMDKRIFLLIKGDILKLYGDMSGNGPRIVAESGSGFVKKESVTMESVPAMVATEVAASPAERTNTEGDIRKVRIGEAPAVEGPTMIHSEAELQPIAQKRRALSSFGGMFGFGKTQGQKPKGVGVTAEVSMVEGVGVRPQEAATTEQRPVRVVHYTSAKAPEDIFGAPAQEQKDATAFTPVTKQEHEVDFEPKVIDLMHSEPIAATPIAQEPQPMSQAGVADRSPIVPVPLMPETSSAVVMKTPQRMEVAAPMPPQGGEPRLADIPINEDVIDLRTLERAEDKK